MSAHSPVHPSLDERDIPTFESLPIDQQAALNELNATYKTLFAQNYHDMMTAALCTDNVINIKSIKSLFSVVKRRDLVAYNAQGIGALYTKLARVGVFSIKGGYVSLVSNAMEVDDTTVTTSASRKRPAKEQVSQISIAKKIAVDVAEPVPQDKEKQSLVDAIIQALQHQRSRPQHTPHVVMMIE